MPSWLLLWLISVTSEDAIVFPEVYLFKQQYAISLTAHMKNRGLCDRIRRRFTSYGQLSPGQQLSDTRSREAVLDRLTKLHQRHQTLA